MEVSRPEGATPHPNTGDTVRLPHEPCKHPIGKQGIRRVPRCNEAASSLRAVSEISLRPLSLHNDNPTVRVHINAINIA